MTAKLAFILLFITFPLYNLFIFIRANAKLVYACEWNPLAVEALRHNLRANLVADRCVVLEGDNRITAPKVCNLASTASVVLAFLDIIAICLHSTV